MSEVATATMNAIHSQLGEARRHRPGFIINNSIFGQMVTKLEENKEHYKPAIISYEATVIEVKGDLLWHVSILKII